MTLPKIWPKNSRTFPFKLRETSLTTGSTVPTTTGTVTAFIATTNQPTATPAAAGLSVAATHVSDGNWLAHFEATALDEVTMNNLFGTPAPNGVLVRHTFSNGTSASTVGPSDIGPTPTPFLVWGVRNGHAYNVSADAGLRELVWTHASIGNAIVKATLAVVSGTPYLIQYGSGGVDDVLYLTAYAGVLLLSTFDGADQQPLEAIAYTPATDDVLEIERNGTTVTARVNGVDMFTAFGVTAGLNGTTWGIGATDSVAEFDTVEISTLPPATPYLIISRAGSLFASQELEYVESRPME